MYTSTLLPGRQVMLTITHCLGPDEWMRGIEVGKSSD